jgi:hypothetical protein
MLQSKDRRRAEIHDAVKLGNGDCAIVHLMSEQNVIVWDLETVPDLSAAARMLGLGAAPEAEVSEALGPDSPNTRSTRSSA